MKKFKLVLATLFVMILGICCLSACNGSVEGTYKFYSMSYSQGGVTIELKAGEKAGIITLNEDFMVVELNADGTAKITAMQADDLQGTGTWKTDEEDSSKVVITINGQSQTFTHSGSELKLTEKDTTIVLKK